MVPLNINIASHEYYMIKPWQLCEYIVELFILAGLAGLGEEVAFGQISDNGPFQYKDAILDYLAGMGYSIS